MVINCSFAYNFILKILHSLLLLLFPYFMQKFQKISSMPIWYLIGLLKTQIRKKKKKESYKLHQLQYKPVS